MYHDNMVQLTVTFLKWNMGKEYLYHVTDIINDIASPIYEVWRTVISRNIVPIKINNYHWYQQTINFRPWEFLRHV